MTVGVVGPAALDTVTPLAGPPREGLGGAPLYAERALRFAGADAAVVVKGAEMPDATFVPGSPAVTSRLVFTADGLRQEIGALAAPFTPEEARAYVVPALRGCRWALLGAQTAGDFPPETIAELGRAGLRLCLDAQGLARGAEAGRVRLRPFPASALAGLDAVKLNEAEAEAAVGSLEPDRLRALGVAEVLVTRGPHGALVVTAADEHRIEGSGVPFDDPTGAGDSWAALYLLGRTRDLPPREAGRFATALVERLYGGGCPDIAGNEYASEGWGRSGS